MHNFVLQNQQSAFGGYMKIKKSASSEDEADFILYIVLLFL